MLESAAAIIAAGVRDVCVAWMIALRREERVEEITEAEARSSLTAAAALVPPDAGAATGAATAGVGGVAVSADAGNESSGDDFTSPNNRSTASAAGATAARVGVAGAGPAATAMSSDSRQRAGAAASNICTGSTVAPAAIIKGMYLGSDLGDIISGIRMATLVDIVVRGRKKLLGRTVHAHLTCAFAARARACPPGGKRGAKRHGATGDQEHVVSRAVVASGDEGGEMGGDDVGSGDGVDGTADEGCESNEGVMSDDEGSSGDGDTQKQGVLAHSQNDPIEMDRRRQHALGCFRCLALGWRPVQNINVLGDCCPHSLAVSHSLAYPERSARSTVRCAAWRSRL